MTAEEMRIRTKQFALRIMKVAEALPNTIRGRTIANQLIRSETSVGANYRAVCRARSGKGFINKLGVVLEEADESAFWLELVSKCSLLAPKRVAPLLQETNELVKIISASRRTALRKYRGTRR
jgi:four helix bundle protein